MPPQPNTHTKGIPYLTPPPESDPQKEHSDDCQPVAASWNHLRRPASTHS